MSVALLAGKIAIVTGGALNIGRAIALELARAGATVVIADIALTKARKVVREIETFGGTALAIATDVRDEAQINALVAQTRTQFRRVDILVNNAAITGTAARTRLGETALEQWDAVQEVCLRSAFLCAQAVAPLMRQQKRGKIINISSVTFWIGAESYAGYVAAKGGLIGMTRSLARELGRDNINVNAITPGGVLTPQEKHVAPPETIAQMVAAQCLPRRLLPRDIAKAVLFLASDLSDAITGQTLNVDCGWAFH